MNKPLDLLTIAKQVYGEHTEWKGIQLQRLQLLAQKIIEAYEATKIKPEDKA